MEDWEYNEIFEVINEDYNDFLSLNRGHEYAIARTKKAEHSKTIGNAYKWNEWQAEEW